MSAAVALTAVVLLPVATGGLAATTRDRGPSASAAITAGRDCPPRVSSTACRKARPPGRRFLQTHV
jgi:hypothetical protein